MMSADLSIDLGKLKLKNPVMVASGTFGCGEEFLESGFDLSKLGAVVTKGISLKPKQGNPPPRVTETSSGMINAIGLQNVGVEAFVKDKLPKLIEAKATAIVNILGNSVDEYARLAQRLDGVEGVDALEINISCPNVASGGISFGADPDSAASVIKASRAVTSLPLIVKLTPLASDIAKVACAVEDAGADMISLINTIPAMAIDIKQKRPVLGNTIGGLSGPAIKPVALRLVWEVRTAVSIPIIGMGGIMTLDDMLEFIFAGASAVQLGTANMIYPNRAWELVTQLKEYISNEKCNSFSDLVNDFGKKRDVFL
ncbi:MAG: dihydroorotate dehydrogenase [Pseudomonadota bacterium]